MSDEEEFLIFWQSFPKKRSKGDARKAWAQTKGIRPPLDEVLAVLEQAKRSADWHKADREGNVGAYVPFPATWIRAEGWADDYRVALPGVGSKLPVTKVELPPPPTEEQRQRARDLLAQSGLRRVA